MQTKRIKKIIVKSFHTSKGPFWFMVGFVLAATTLISIFIIVFQNFYKNRVIPGVFIENVYVGEKSKETTKEIFDEKNRSIQDSTFVFTFEEKIATVSAKELNIGYNSQLIADQAAMLGKSSNIFANFFIIITSYLNGTTLNSSYTFNDEVLNTLMKPIEQYAYTEPVDALFSVENNRVATFRQSIDGRKLDVVNAKKFVEDKVPIIIASEKNQTYVYEIPSITIAPATSTEEANKFGIVEEIGVGKSFYRHSIPNRVHNVSLAASRLNGILVKPEEEFSFAKYLGDVSKYTGYKEAYIIQGGKTILGDGGGVCQVSSTLFRAILNSGLPIIERHAHAYRVGYYEQESPPGLDATVYVPTVDLKFKNDTKNYILIQTYVDPTEESLTFVMYGKKDGREVEVTTPVVTNVSAAPEPLYQDDPTLPAGVVKQIDYAAPGATVVFRRIVKKDDKTVIDEKYTSRYTPWRAVFLRGTKTD